MWLHHLQQQIWNSWGHWAILNRSRDTCWGSHSQGTRIPHHQHSKRAQNPGSQRRSANQARRIISSNTRIQVSHKRSRTAANPGTCWRKRKHSHSWSWRGWKVIHLKSSQERHSMRYNWYCFIKHRWQDDRSRHVLLQDQGSIYQGFWW